MRAHLVSGQKAQHHIRVDTIGNVGVNTIDPSDLGSTDFTRHTTTTGLMRGAAGHGFHTRVNFFHYGNEGGLRMQAWVSGVEALQVGQDDQNIRLHQITYHGRERIVVPETDFLDRHCVIFINDGDHAVLQQRQQRIAGVEVACTGAQILVRQENLRHFLLKDAEQAFIRPDEWPSNAAAAC